MTNVLCPYCQSPHNTFTSGDHSLIDSKDKVKQYKATAITYRCMACGKTHTTESDRH